MTLLIYLLIKLTVQTKERYELAGNDFNLIYDSEISLVTCNDNNTTCHIQRYDLNINVNAEEALVYFKNIKILGNYYDDCLTNPIFHNISLCSSDISDTILEFKDKAGEVLFHTKVITEGQKKYLTDFSEGPYDSKRPSAEMEISYIDISISCFMKSYFVVSKDLDLKVKLDKSVVACEILSFIDELHGPFDDLFQCYFSTYRFLGNLKGNDEEKIAIIKDETMSCLQSNFCRIQDLRINIKDDFDTKEYEEEIEREDIPSSNFTLNIMEDLDNIVDKEVDDTRIKLQYITDLIDNLTLSKEEDKIYRDIKFVWNTKVLLSVISNMKTKFLNILNERIANYTPYIEIRNNKYRKALSERKEVLKKQVLEDQALDEEVLDKEGVETLKESIILHLNYLLMNLSEETAYKAREIFEETEEPTPDGFSVKIFLYSRLEKELIEKVNVIEECKKALKK